ncbi:MAG: nicotinate-nucleotide--dimethylbenzimidazole phosphoribosyltransferase [Gemmataceae bacterium]|nr:nicotinate-nucleotide--dimethylbenzimidazole phosphoribosyltransferase [Gemmataceae bacterium]
MLPNISPLDPSWLARAGAHQQRLTMPRGALGRLLDVGRQLCSIQQTLTPHADPAAVVVMAADHGVVEEGVSAYPQEVTAQMVANFLRGGAAINVLARCVRAGLCVVNMGVKDPAGLARGDGLFDSGTTSLGPGTANFLRGPALTEEQTLQAIATGRRVLGTLHEREGVRVVALGEMGIGNTTSASALTAALTRAPVEAVTGSGTGLDESQRRHKIAVIERALTLHFPGRTGSVSPLEALTAVGGFEIAGLVGVALEAAAHRIAVVLDGFISSVAGLVAARLQPAVVGYLFASHRSPEPGHRVVLETLGLMPLLDLGLRLGEGTGAALALPLLQSAADVMRDMATFEQAGVSDRPG